MKFVLTSLTMLIVLITGCEPDNLTADPLFIKLEPDAGTATFTITSNVAWTIESTVEWISIDPAEGINDAVVTLTSTSNPGYDSRNSMLTISGGEAADVKVNVVQDPKEGPRITWVQKTDMPTARNFISPHACVLDGKIYVIGGSTALGDPLDVVEEYDPVSDRWAVKAPLLNARWGHIAEQAGGKIYVMGGCFTTAGGQANNTMEVYDPAEDEWTSLGAMPISTVGLASCVVNEKIYILGGRYEEPGGEYYDDMYRYDPIAKEWTSLASMPSPNAYFSVSEAGGSIYVAGGVQIGAAGAAVNTVYKYDISADTWMEGPPLKNGRWGIVSCSLDSLVICAGGYTGPTDMGESTVEIINSNADVVMGTTPMLFSTADGSMCQLDGKIYYFGGTTTSPPDYGANKRVLEGTLNVP